MLTPSHRWSMLSPGKERPEESENLLLLYMTTQSTPCPTDSPYRSFVGEDSHLSRVLGRRHREALLAIDESVQHGQNHHRHGDEAGVVQRLRCDWPDGWERHPHYTIREGHHNEVDR